MKPPAPAPVDEPLARRLDRLIQRHIPLISQELPGSVPCAERCGTPVITAGINAHDIVLFRDRDELAHGVLHFEIYHRTCALRAYGMEHFA